MLDIGALSNDPRVVGEYIAFSIERLDITVL